MKGLHSDLHHAIRLYATTPLSTALAIGLLALGLAFVAVFVSMWNDIALRPHPGFIESRSLVTITQEIGTDTRGLTSGAIRELSEHSNTLDGVAGIKPATRVVELDGHAQLASMEFVTDGFFAGLRPSLLFGRPLDDLDHRPGAKPVAVLSHGFWQREFGGRRDVLGEELFIRSKPTFVSFSGGESRDLSDSGQTYRIVGVMGSTMQATFGGVTDLWAAFEPDASFHREMLSGEVSLATKLATVARLASGRSREAAADEVSMILGGDTRARLELDPDARIRIRHGAIEDVAIHREALRQVHLFLIASVLVAMVTAINVGLFMLSRAPGRRREVGIRFAVGASRRRILRQLVTEAGLMVSVAAMIGSLASIWLATLLQTLPFLQGVSWRDFTLLDWRVVLLLVLAALLLTGFAAAAPLGGFRNASIASAMARVAARASPAQQASATAQIALAGLLAAVALTFNWHLVNLASTDIGFDPAGIVVATPKAEPERIFGASWEQTLAKRNNQREALLGVAGISGVGFGNPVPAVSQFAFSMHARNPEDTDRKTTFTLVSIDPEYPRLLGMQLLAGRLPESGNPMGVLVNETFARALWGQIDVLGEPVPLPDHWTASLGGKPRIAGVLADASFSHPEEAVSPMLFHPSASNSATDSIIIQTRLAPSDIRSALQAMIRDGEIDFRLSEVHYLADRWNDALAADRARSGLTAAAALVVVVLAGFGFYGMQRYMVAAGRREYAILAALGAGPGALGRVVLKRGLTIALPGLILCVPLAYLAAAWLQDRFVGPGVHPWGVSAAVGLGVVSLVVLASLGPAARVRRIVPSSVLREE
jgi:putative ABC transport system permease protein